MTVSYPTITDVATEARPYPTYLLENASSGLCLFSAAFMGHNEAIHFVLEEVQTTCVDIDQEKLHAMAALYPDDWEFVCRDAWEFADAAHSVGMTWDVVSVDTFRGNATEKSLDDLDVWCAIANQAVIATLADDVPYDVPDGWTESRFQRNSEVDWLVLQRD
jgi:hypothetical protein